jgi:hypothetical protein
MERPTCGTCPYWMSLESEDFAGSCKRYPPTIPATESQVGESKSVAEGVGLFLGWSPTTDNNDWCGEHPDFPAYLKARATEAEPKAVEQVTS